MGLRLADMWKVVFIGLALTKCVADPAPPEPPIVQQVLEARV